MVRVRMQLQLPPECCGYHAPPQKKRPPMAGPYNDLLRRRTRRPCPGPSPDRIGLICHSPLQPAGCRTTRSPGKRWAVDDVATLTRQRHRWSAHSRSHARCRYRCVPARPSLPFLTACIGGPQSFVGLHPLSTSWRPDGPFVRPSTAAGRSSRGVPDGC